MVEKKDYYVKGFKIAIIIVLSLLLINFLIDQKRVFKLNEEYIKYSWDMEESKLFFLFLDSVKNENMTCPILKQRLTQLANKNVEVLNELEKYENVNVFSNQYFSLKKTFSLRNLELYFYYSQYKKQCSDKAHYILYFYPNNRECADCKIQASILDNVRDQCNNIIVFALPTDSDSDVINLIKFKYNIVKEPSIIIDDRDVFSGVASKSDILGKINCTEEKILS